MLNKLKNETDIKAFMRQVLLLVWTLGYVTKKKERQMASLVRRCRIQLTTEAEGTVRVPVQTSKGAMVSWVDCPVNRVYIPPPCFGKLNIIRQPECTMVLHVDKNGVSSMDVLRETLRLLSLDQFTASRGWGERSVGYGSIRYYRGRKTFVETAVENEALNDAAVDLAADCLAKQLGCYCFWRSKERDRATRQLLYFAEQKGISKRELIRGLFHMGDFKEYQKRLSELHTDKEE